MQVLIITEGDSILLVKFNFNDVKTDFIITALGIFIQCYT